MTKWVMVAVLMGFVPAHAQKTLHIAFTAAETTFDPAASDDIPSSDIIRMVFDPPLDYDYHARPVALRPATLASLPGVSADGRTVMPPPDERGFFGKMMESVGF